MPAITTNDLKNGITLELDNGLFQVVEFQHVKPGKGGAFVRTKLRNVKNGNVFDRTFNAGVRVEQALLDKKDMQFLYRDGEEYVFMDTNRLGNGSAFLQVLEERPAGIPDFEEVKEQVRSQLKERKVMELARGKADALRATLLSEGAEKAGLQLLTTESFFRGGQLPEAGRSPEVNARAFSLTPGELSAPLSADNGYVLVRVLEKTGFNPADFSAQKSDFLEQMANEQRVRVWNAFVESLTAPL